MSGDKRVSYSEKERVILAELVKEHRDIIECKKTDCTSIKTKQVAWESIALKFNAQPEVSAKRSSGQLKKCWDNIKQR